MKDLPEKISASGRSRRGFPFILHTSASFDPDDPGKFNSCEAGRERGSSLIISILRLGPRFFETIESGANHEPSDIRRGFDMEGSRPEVSLGPRLMKTKGSSNVEHGRCERRGHGCPTAPKNDFVHLSGRAAEYGYVATAGTDVFARPIHFEGDL